MSPSDRIKQDVYKRQMPYSEALAVQLECHERVRQGEEDTLFLVEHPPVITFGRHGGEENLLLDRAELEARGVETVKTDRGGNITCHFPGQLVAYPVFRVGKRTNGLHGFVRTLEEIVIRTAAAFEVEAARWEGRPGVWIGNRKLCSLGMCAVSYTHLVLFCGHSASLRGARLFETPTRPHQGALSTRLSPARISWHTSFYASGLPRQSQEEAPMPYIMAVDLGGTNCRFAGFTLDKGCHLYTSLRK